MIDDRLIDWLIDWLVEFIGRIDRWNWLTDWLIDWLIDWLTDWLNWLIGWLIGSLIGFTKRHAVFLYCKLFLPKPPVIQWRTWSETTSESQYSLLNYGHSRTGVIKLAYSITQFSSYDSFHSFSMSKSMDWALIFDQWTEERYRAVLLSAALFSSCYVVMWIGDRILRFHLIYWYSCSLPCIWEDPYCHLRLAPESAHMPDAVCDLSKPASRSMACTFKI